MRFALSGALQKLAIERYLVSTALSFLSYSVQKSGEVGAPFSIILRESEKRPQEGGDSYYPKDNVDRLRFGTQYGKGDASADDEAAAEVEESL